MSLVLLFAWMGVGLRADEADLVFSKWKEILESSAKRLGETQVLKWDKEKGLLTLGQELQLNEMRKNTLLQIVPVSALVVEIQLEGVSTIQEPWIKLRCRNNQKKVKIQRRVIIEGVEVEEVSKDDDRAFLVITCHRSDLKKAKELGEQFLALAGAGKN